MNEIILNCLIIGTTMLTSIAAIAGNHYYYRWDATKWKMVGERDGFYLSVNRKTGKRRIERIPQRRASPEVLAWLRGQDD